MAWLAVRDQDPTAALGLTELGEVDWRSGVDLAYFTDDRLIVTPPVDGWFLVLGMALLRDRPDVTGLSAALATEVQYFSSHRGLQVYRWQRARSGDLLRSFASTEGEIDELGEASDLERSFGQLVDDGDVYRVAAQWSVDPGTLNVPVRVLRSGTVSGGQA
jgi:hypothetical protein